MESSKNNRVEKRGYELVEEVEDAQHHLTQSKKPKLPGLASVIVEALKVDSLQRLCSSLEPLLRKIVSEEVERALAKLGHAKLVERSSPPRIEGPGAKNLQLHFRTRMPPHLFTGGKVDGEQGAAIHVVLLDPNTGNVVQVGPESVAKLNVVVLEGDFNEEVDDDWTKEHFESHEVKEREGKRPLLTGDLQVSLKEGVGTLGDLTFTDNSSWIRSRKFRLGVKVAPGYCEGTRIREGKTDAFAVKDHRGELYKKHYPPALHDEVWRLDRIAKDGALHKKLIQAKIATVEDFLRILVREPQKLRSILGSGMSNRMWENTVEHAKTCVLGGKLFVYYTDGTNSAGIVFNNIYELRGLIADGQFFSLESLTPNQKMSVDSLVKKAYENWDQVVEYDGKVLNSLSNSKKGSRSVASHTIYHNSFQEQQYTSAKNRMSYVSSEPNQHLQITNNYASGPGLSDYPFGRCDSQMVGTSLNNSQLALPGSMNYMSSENPEIEGPYFGGDWSRPRNEQGLEDIVAEELRLRSSEMLESDDMQRLLKTINAGVSMSTNLGHSSESCYAYSLQYEPQMYHSFGEHHGKSSGKAVVGWLKLKAALRWGIFIRKRAAQKRAQLTELN
ncbi:calmodulin-binding protein 60 F-like isoform X1 [Abrus precatorius]|uniref:Calmodulin-binding protein 60 F-like isoform X1 n=1 Tax=Abrus precatorius TaxID=3816 RepID=A0A8B8LGV8_ABRPR|nr:calmodulin-binding protein 60 F-like isoform X1 [Abrus precatorius]